MSRFYIDPECIKENKIFAKGEELHHIIDVMRLKIGDEVDVFDGKGNIYGGIIESILKYEAIIKIVSRKTLDSNSRISIALAQAIPKKNKMEDIIEKCTELGVDEIIPIITERTIVKIKSDNAAGKLLRWRKIAKEASKQCGRAEIADVLSIESFEDVVQKIEEFDMALIPCLYGVRIKIKEILKEFKGKRILFFIGPEGDFTKKEIELAKEYGALPCDLGENVLRVDTAAIATLAIIKHDLDGG